MTDTNFEELKKEYDNYKEQFNSLYVTGISRTEIRHSNVLAWLLDGKNKYIGDLFLKEFIKVVNKEFKSGIPDNIGSIEVKREWENIDILLKFTADTTTYIIVIENKIDAAETGRQLSKYKNVVDKKYPEKSIKIYIKLSPQGTLPEYGKDRGDWKVLSYSDILDCLLNVRQKGIYISMNASAKDFIEQYINILRFELSADKTLMEKGMNVIKTTEVEKFKNAQNQLQGIIEEAVNKFVRGQTDTRYNQIVIRFCPKDINSKFGNTETDFKETNANKFWEKNNCAFEFILNANALIFQFTIKKNDKNNNQSKLWNELSQSKDTTFEIEKDWGIVFRDTFYFKGNDSNSLNDLNERFKDWSNKFICWYHIITGNNGGNTESFDIKLKEDLKKELSPLFNEDNEVYSFINNYQNSLRTFVKNKILKVLDNCHEKFNYFDDDKGYIRFGFDDNTKQRGGDKKSGDFWEKYKYAWEFIVSNDSLKLQFCAKVDVLKEKNKKISVNEVIVLKPEECYKTWILWKYIDIPLVFFINNNEARIKYILNDISNSNYKYQIDSMLKNNNK